MTMPMALNLFDLVSEDHHPTQSHRFRVRPMTKVYSLRDMKVMHEDRLPMSLENMREGCRVFVRLGSCRMEVVGRLVEECREPS